MANFCYDCTVKLFGAEHGSDNDFQGLCSNPESAQVLCEGCGFIEVNSDGRKIRELKQ